VITVWDVENERMTEVPIAEAATGMIRYARSLGPGTPACGVYEQRAVELLRTGQ
jgi:hypothetical protein